MKRITHRLFVAIAVVALLAVGCASDDDGDTGTTTPGATTETTTPGATTETTTPGATTDGDTTDGDATDGATDDAGSAAWAATVEAAAGQSVRIYHPAAPAQADRFIEVISEVYPNITVTHERGGRALIERLQSEIAAGSPGADILVFPDEGFFRDNQDLFANLEGPSAAEFPQDGFVIPDRIATIETLAQTIILWNTNEFPDGFEGYEDVLGIPAGRLGLRDVYSGPLCGHYDFMEEQFGPGYLESLGELDPVPYGSTTESSQAVAAGEIGIIIEGQPANALELESQGAPVDSLIFEDPAFGQPFQGGVIAESENAEAAQVVMDFLLSAEGQEAWNGGGYAASVRPDVAGAASSEGWVLFDYTRYTPEAVEQCQQTVDDIVFGR